MYREVFEDLQKRYDMFNLHKKVLRLIGRFTKTTSHFCSSLRQFLLLIWSVCTMERVHWKIIWGWKSESGTHKAYLQKRRGWKSHREYFYSLVFTFSSATRWTHNSGNVDINKTCFHDVKGFLPSGVLYRFYVRVLEPLAPPVWLGPIYYWKLFIK